MIISQNNFDFEQHGIAIYQKMLALNPVFCVCQNDLFELLTIIMFCHFVEAVWRLKKFFQLDRCPIPTKCNFHFKTIKNQKIKAHRESQSWVPIHMCHPVHTSLQTKALQKIRFVKQGLRNNCNHHFETLLFKGQYLNRNVPQKNIPNQSYSCLWAL